jgi:hypothetical protein
MAFHQAGAGGANDSVRFGRSVDYSLLGQRVEVKDEVDTTLVRPRPRKYETAGAASAAAKG